MAGNRPLHLAVAGLLAAGATFSGSAQAQSQCGASYEIRQGDTLYSISQSCRVTLARIMDLNPSLGDPRDISVGTEIRLEPRDGSGDRTDADGQQSTGDTAVGVDGRYLVQEGDTLFSIAQAAGVSLMELMQENAELDPLRIAVGELLNVPGDGPGAAIDVTPQRGSTEDTVTVHARGLRPNDWVTIGVGSWASEWSAVREVQVGADGDLSAQVDVPNWADSGDDLIFVVDTDRGVTLKSDVFHVVEDGGEDVNGDRLMLEGRVARGPECYTIETPAGETWSMVSDRVEFTQGEYVEVTGQRAEASVCMRGVDTIDVAHVQEVQPPPGAEPGGDEMTLEGRIGRGPECHTIKTPQGEVWSIVSDSVSFNEGAYVEVTGSRADMSICMRGQGTVEVSSVSNATPPQ